MRWALSVGLLVAVSGSVAAQHEYATIDRFVPHVSTVPANAGQRVGLFLREKLGVRLQDAIDGGQVPEGRVVLFVHGNSVPSVPDFDLPYRDYSWMEHLAAAGFDTFAMDHTGYGYSPRPAMDDPCNLVHDEQRLLVPHTLEDSCDSSYKHLLTNSESDWSEIDSVVDYIRRLRDVSRVSLIGWSRGGPRIGGYAARFPEKVDKLVLFAPGYQADQATDAPAPLPPPGRPMSLQTREALMQNRWQANVACENQVDPGIRDVIWQTIMAFDSLGSAWLPEGVMRVRVASYYGWNSDYAARVEAPTLILVGEQDGLLPSARSLYSDLSGTASKVLVTMDCATHFANWEAAQYRFMHQASAEWLLEGRFRGEGHGIFAVDYGGAARAPAGDGD